MLIMTLSEPGGNSARVRVTFSVGSGILSSTPSTMTHDCLTSLLSARKLLRMLKSSATRERERAVARKSGGE